MIEGIKPFGVTQSDAVELIALKVEDVNFKLVERIDLSKIIENLQILSKGQICTCLSKSERI